MSTPIITYVGDATIIAGGTGGNNNAWNGFIDQHEPVPGKTEWGMDTLTRTLKGAQPNLAAFVAALVQGLTYSFNGHTFYLQTWDPDNNPVLPAVALVYKGLVGGIPTPKASGDQIEQSISLTANNVGDYTTATREIQYVTRQTNTLYIASARPTAATYGMDIDLDPQIISSVITAEDANGANYRWTGEDAPADLVTALTPANAVKSFMKCSPVVGSPFFECADVATNTLAGS